MRLLAAFGLLLVILSCISVTPVQAFDQVDFNIFDLHDYIQKNLGEGSTFYSAIGIEKSASERDISRAWRKLSLQLHPDKNPDKKAQDLYQHLTSVVELLKDGESRERYDLHLKVGIPKWRGTGYFYHRYRPGLPTVLVFLAIFITVVQFISGWASYHYEHYKLSAIAEEINQIGISKVRRAVGKATGKDVVRTDLKQQTPLEVIAEAHGVDPEMLRPKPPQIRNLWIFTMPVWTVKTIYNAPQTWKNYQERKAQIKAWEEARKKEIEEEEAALAAEKEERRMEDEARKKRDEERKARRRMKAIQAEEESQKRKEEARQRLTDSFGGRAASFNSKATEELSSGDDDEGTGAEGNAAANGEGLRNRKPAEPVKQLNTSPTWTAAEISKLAALTKKYPGGTAGRWVRIAGDLNREVDAVVDMARRVNENPRLLTEGYKAESSSSSS